MSEIPSIQCPFAFATYFGVDPMIGMSPVERSAFCLLAVAAWHQRPPGSLPDDPAWLAAVAGVAPHDWPSVSARVLRDFTPRNGALVCDIIACAYEAALNEMTDGLARRLADRERQRRRRERLSRGCHADVTVTAPSAPFLSSAPSAQRPDSERREDERPGAQSGVIGFLGAGAQGAGEELFRERWKTHQRAWSASIMRAARFEWADGRHQAIPPNVISDVLTLPHATPQQVSFVLWRIRQEKYPNPIANFIRGMGATRRKTPPWQVTLDFNALFAEHESKRRAQIVSECRAEALRYGLHTPKTTGGERPATGARV